MTEIHELLGSQPMSLIVSLPANRIELAQAAIDGGADVVKLHINVKHRASGNSFGTLSSNLAVIRDIRKMCTSQALGIVPGDAIDKVHAEEIDQLKHIGVDYLSLYAHHAPAWLLEDREVRTMLAIDYTYSPQEIAALQSLPIDAIEASIMHPEMYGTALSARDIAKYKQIADQVRQPVIVPTQKRILEEEVRALWRAGARGLMIGAVVTGSDERSVFEATRRYKSSIDNIVSSPDGLHEK